MIFLLHGENTYSSAQKLKAWKLGFLKKYGEDGQIESPDTKNLNIPEFITNMMTLPFLCEKRLIILKDFFINIKTDKQKQLAEVLNKTPDFCILIFHEEKSADKRTSLYKTIKKLGTVEDFPELDNAQTSRWIQKHFQLQAPIASYLTQYAGTNLWKLSNEIEKLKTYNPEISKENIHKLVRPSLSTSIFNLTDSISQKNIQKSLSTLNNLVESGEDIHMIFHMIVRQFRLTIQIKDLAAKNQTNRIKQHPFVIKKTSQQAHNFSPQKLQTIYKELLKIDRDTKTGKIKTSTNDTTELQFALEKLIVACSN